MNEEKITLLKELGLTNLQANIYIVLMSNPGITGYKIARILDEPVSNTYKALDTLQKNGVILVDESSGKRIYFPQPISDYLDQMELTFKKKRQNIERELKNIGEIQVDEGIFKIEKIDQLYERAAKMIRSADEIVAVDSTPVLLENLSKDLEKISKKGIRVLIKAYTNFKIPGCEIIYSEDMANPIENQPVEWLNLIITGKEHLTALTDKKNERIFQAVWCKNRFLTLVNYNGYFTEYLLTQTMDSLHKGDSNKKIIDHIEEMRSLSAGNIASTRKYLKMFEKI